MKSPRHRIVGIYSEPPLGVAPHYLIALYRVGDEEPLYILASQSPAVAGAAAALLEWTDHPEDLASAWKEVCRGITGWFNNLIDSILGVIYLDTHVNGVSLGEGLVAQVEAIQATRPS